MHHELPALTLSPGRRRLLGLLLLCAAFVATGMLMLRGGVAFGWVVIAFFGIGLLVFPAMLLPRFNHLRIDHEGFAARSLWRRQGARWPEVAELGLFGVPGDEHVAWRLHAPGATASRELTAWDGMLADRYGMDVAALLALMQRYRAAQDHEAGDIC